MNRPLTDRERILQLEARNRELEDELREYRAWENNTFRPSIARLASDDKLNAIRRTLTQAFDLAGGLCPAVILIRLLASSPHVMLREDLFEATRPYGFAPSDGDTKTVDVQIVHLRKALAKLGFPGVIKTLRCVGYLIEAPHADAIKTALGIGA